MATNLANYGAYSPQALEPYPIESVLAKEAYSGYGNSPAEAQTALDQYWLERQGHEQQYAQELNTQHEFARQQLQNQLYEANMKAMGEAKDPTVLQLMANSPMAQAGPLAGIDPGALTDLVQRARQGQDVTNLEHAGQGINAISQGGFDPTAAAGKAGITSLGQYSGPAMVQAARINAAARVAAAQISAANKSTGVSESVATAPDASGLVHNLHFPKGMSAEQQQQYLENRGYVQPPLSEGTKGIGSTLPRAQTDPGVSGTASTPAKAAPPGNADALGRVRQWINTGANGQYSPQQLADIRAGMAKNNGMPVVVQEGGKHKLKGASGQSY